MYFIPRIH